jgi:hypothetical protein
MDRAGMPLAFELDKLRAYTGGILQMPIIACNALRDPTGMVKSKTCMFKVYSRLHRHI